MGAKNDALAIFKNVDLRVEDWGQCDDLQIVINRENDEF